MQVLIQIWNFNWQVAPAVEYLIHSYPKYVTVESLPLPSIDQRVSEESLSFNILH